MSFLIRRILRQETWVAIGNPFISSRFRRCCCRAEYDTVVGQAELHICKLDTHAQLTRSPTANKVGVQLILQHLEQYILYKSATSHCTCILLYSLYSFVVYTQSKLPTSIFNRLPLGESVMEWKPSPQHKQTQTNKQCYPAKEIAFAAHDKNMCVVSSSKLCQSYLLHWRRNN